MNRATLLSDLARGESGTTFTFDPAAAWFSAADWAGVRTFVSASMGAGASAGTLRITGFTKTVGPVSSGYVQYTGTAPALLAQRDGSFAQAPLLVVAVFWLTGPPAQGAPLLCVSATPAAATLATWTLPTSVSGTGGSALDQVFFTAASFTLASAAGTNPVSRAAVTAGVHFGGTLANRGVFTPPWPLLSDPAALAVAGTLTIGTGVTPTFDLRAAGTRARTMRPFPFPATLGTYLTSFTVPVTNPAGDEQFLEAGLWATVSVGGSPVELKGPLVSDAATLLTLNLPAPAPLASWAPLKALTGGDLDTLLPKGVPAAGVLSLDQLVLTLDPAVRGRALVTSLLVGVSVTPAQPWTILPGGMLELATVGMRFFLPGPATSETPNTTLHGVFASGATRCLLAATVPSLNVYGELLPGAVIPLSDLASHFFTGLAGGAWEPPIPLMNVVALELAASPRSRQYALEGVVQVGTNDAGWTVDLFSDLSLSLQGLAFNLSYDGSAIGAWLSGELALSFGTQSVDFVATVGRDPDGTWHLSSGTPRGETIDLVNALALLTSWSGDEAEYGFTPLAITDLELALDAASDGSGWQATGYVLAAATAGQWTFTVGGFAFGIDASVKLEGTRSGTVWSRSGQLAGNVAVRNLTLGAVYDFSPGNWSLLFQLRYAGRGLTATLYTEGGDTRVKVSLGALSFGEVVGYLVGLARPGTPFTLPAPWDVLYQVNLKDVSLVANLTRSEVGIRYAPHATLGFLTLDAVQLDYRRNARGRDTVRIAIEGTFLDHAYGAGDPLAWDLLDEAPPAVPGKGTGLVDVRYLALGQHVGVPAALGAATVAGALDALKTAMMPATDRERSPLLQPGGTGLEFDPNTGVIFAAEVALLDGSVTLGAVLWDPWLYALSIALAGERAGAFAGLAFELQYRKVNDEIGVFEVDLHVPDAFRQIQLGEVAITLGTVKVDLYTNGDFRVDLGFPRGGDFSRSFGAQVFPFVGSGGLYFAKLNGQTSTTVPVVTNGVFSPVLEAGLGLSLGVGKDLAVGPLTAGLTVTLNAILEGTLAWFNPTGGGTPTALYFRLQGTASLVGRIYGTVDFYVVRAAVTVTANATVAFTVESYEPITFTLSATVRADAQVKVLFVTTHFSTTIQVEQPFTLGSRGTPPWLPAPGAAGAGGPTLIGAARRDLLMMPRRLRERAFSGRPGWRLLHDRVPPHLRAAEDFAAIALDWSPRTFFRTPVPVLAYALPAFTVAVPSGVFPPAVPPPPDTPRVEGVLLLLLPNGISPNAWRAEEADVRFVPLPGTPSFDILVELMLRWAISSLPGSAAATEVTRVDLAEILRSMEESPATTASGFSYDTLAELFLRNVQFSVSGSTSEPPVGGTVFPMIPAFSMTGPAAVDFAAFNPVDDAYAVALADWFAQTRLDVGSVAADSPFGGGSVAPPPLGGTESFATVVFRDWFLMLAKAAVQAALDTMTAWPATTAAGASLESIAAAFPRETLTWIALPGDTIDSIAALFGMTPAALRTLNGLPAGSNATTPGDALLVDAGVTAVSVAVANQDVPLDGTSPLTVAGLAVQVQGGTTFAGLATRFGVTDAQLGTASAASTTLLLPGATLTVPSFTHVAIAGDTFDFLAAFYTARNGGVEDGTDLAWYTQAVFALNPTAFSGPLTAGTTLQVPAGYQLSVAGQPATQSYTTRAGDTRDLVAAYFCLLQPARAASLAALTAELQLLNPTVVVGPAGLLPVGTILTIPSIAHTVGAGDTLGSIAASFTLDSQSGGDAVTPAQLATANAAAAVLAPLGVAVLPTLPVAVAADDTLGSVAAALGLSVSELAGAVAAQTGLYAADTALTVPRVPKTGIELLLQTLLASPAVNRIATQASRFFASGLRLPAPGFAGDAPVYSLFSLTGQQFAAPPAANGLTIGLQSSVPWSVVGTGPVTLTPAELVGQYPSTTAAPAFATAPAPLDPLETVPLRVALQSEVAWQAADLPPMAGGAAIPAAPSLWLFPETLVSLAAAGDGTAFKVVSIAAGAVGAPETELQAYEWATLVPITLRTADATGSPSGATYLVDGADDQGDRDRLLAAWQWLLPTNTHAVSPEDAADTRLFLLYVPNGAGPNPTGVASDALDAAKTFLLKTNTATDTPASSTAPDDDPGYYASLDTPLQFLQLLWEASVTPTGGYALHYATDTGVGLPPGVFSQNGRATLWVLVVLGTQSAATTPDRAFHTFNNVAVVGDTVDSSADTLFAESADGSLTTTVLAIAPGNVGFHATVANPTPVPPATPTADERTRMLYSLVGYAVGSTTRFAPSHAALPVPPLRPHSGDTGTWSYTQLLPAARFARSHPLPDSAALPSRLADPYAGVRAPGTIGTGDDVVVACRFVDVFGNVTAGADTPLTVPFVYTDDLIGVAAWPGVSLSYVVAAGPAVQVRLALRVSTYVAGAGSDYATAVSAASTHAKRYQDIYYQVQQAGVTARLRTTLDNGTNYPLGTWRLTGMVNGAYAFLTSASRLLPKMHTVAAGETLATIAAAYGVDAAGLLAENAGLDAAALFASAVTVPRFHVVAAGDTLVAVATGAGISVGALATLNPSAPIPAGTDFVIPTATRTTLAGETLAAFADRAGCTAADVARANAARTGIFTVGIALSTQGVSVVTGAADSFTTLTAAFAALQRDVTVAELAELFGGYTELVVRGTALNIDRHLATAGTTLATAAAASATTVAAFATLNQSVPDLVAASALLRLDTAAVTPEPGETIGSFAADRARTSLAALVGDNGSAALNAGVALRIPLQTLLPAETLYVPFTVRAGDTLLSIAVLFSASFAAQVALLELNRELQGLISAGVPVVILGVTVVTGPDDSLQTILNNFARLLLRTVSWTQLAAAILNLNTFFRPGAVLMAPLPFGKLESLPLAALAYGVDLADLASANASLTGVLASGGTVTVGGESVTVGPEDTLAKLVARFATLGVDTTLVAVASAPGVAIARGARFLLPPAAAEVAVTLRAGYTFPSAIFPVEVDLELLRPAASSAAPLRVRQSISPVPPRSEGGDDAVSLAAFADAFEAAFGGSVKAASAPGRGPAGDDVRQLWAVDFRAAGISSVTLSDEVAFFAFRPLATTLQSKDGVAIQPYTSGVGLGAAVSLDYQAVDLEAWLRTFLTAVDLALTPAYAAPLFLLPVPATSPPDDDPHAVFDEIVAAREAIAGALAENLVQILDAPAPRGDPAAARAAVREKLKVELSTAYAVTAVVQVATEVQSSLPAVPGSRLTFTPRSVTRTTGVRDGFSAVAALYGGVAPQEVALTLAFVPGILLEQTLTYRPNRRSVLVGPHTTLAMVAAAVGAPDVADLVSNLVGAPVGAVFRPGVEIPASLFSVAIPAGATLGSLADYFVRPVEDVAVANQAVQSIFVPSRITIGGRTISTSLNDSIQRMAVAFGMTVPTFAESIRDTVQLRSGVVVKVMRLVPDAVWTPAQTALTTGASTLNFLFNAAKRREFRSIWLDLQCVAGELQHDIVTPPGVTGYARSRWLSFLRPIGGGAGATPPAIDASLGAVRVPTPLREYPEPPVLVEQTAAATTPGAATAALVNKWTYSFEYQYGEAAQDTVTLDTRFNEPSASTGGGSPVEPLAQALFAPLAQFAATYPLLKADLALLLDPATPGDVALLGRVQVAIATLRELVGAVTSAFTSSGTGGGGTGTPLSGDTIRYEARDTTRMAAGRRVYDKFILDVPGTGEAGPNGAFPAAAWVGLDGVAHSLAADPPSATRATYAYAPTLVSTSTRISHLLSFAALDITDFQRVRSGMHVTRNRSLLFAASPLQTEPGTNAAFVFQTPHLDFGTTIPLISSSAPILLGTGGDMEAILTAFFSDLLNPDGRELPVSVSVDFEYPLITPATGPAVTVSLPVVMGPVAVFDTSPVTGTVAALVAAINQWERGKGFSSTDGTYVFRVSLFSSLASQPSHPLMVLSNVQWQR